MAGARRTVGRLEAGWEAGRGDAMLCAMQTGLIHIEVAKSRRRP
jgi:hypothetical protein